MRLAIAAATSLARQALAALRYDANEAALIADHLIDCDLRGLPVGGLARIISIGERLARIGDRRAPMRIVRETAVSAQIDGGDQIGYLVAHRATRLATDKAKVSGIAIVGANQTWYTGMLSYYAEMMAAEGLVSIDGVEHLSVGRAAWRERRPLRHQPDVLRLSEHK
ncbi:MAG TPA: Ldh family oxidoreductase [Xanthobacteraceae bacterium]|nr:Ldh family oxidoreductase [Xanthobacteraceae bacterium]